jgi:methyl-accepting chemotaxis protein
MGNGNIMSIKYKFLIPIISVLLAASVVQFMIISDNLDEEFQETKIAFYKSKVKDIEIGQSRIIKKAFSHVSLYAKLPGVIEAYQHAHQGNIDNPKDPYALEARLMLRDAVTDIILGYNSISKKPYKLHFHLPNGRSFVRTWRNEEKMPDSERLDDLSSFRQTVLDINKAPHKAIGGIELGRAGFAIRGILPISDEAGNHLGSVEIIFPFLDLITFAKTSDEQNFAAYMHAEYLPITQKLRKNPKKYPVLDKKYVVLNSTDKKITMEKITPKVLDKATSDKAYFSSVDNYGLAIIPIKDYYDKNIGKMVFLLDNTPQLANLEKNRTIMMLVSSASLILLSLLIIIFATIFTRKIRKISSIANLLSLGKWNDSIEINDHDEIGDLQESFNKLIETQQERTDIAKNIGSGNIDVQIDILSDQDNLGIAMVEMKDNINSLAKELNQTLKKQMAGELDARCNSGSVNGAYKQILEGINETLDAVINPMREATSLLTDYANGNLEHKMRELPGKQIELTNGLNKINSNLNALIDEGVELSKKIQLGQLNTRGNIDKFSGSYKSIISGFNQTLDALITPFKVSAEYIRRIGAGDIPEKITDEYQGEFNETKESLNSCISAIQLLVIDTKELIGSAVNGKLDDRANSTLHQGEFKTIVEGINQTLNAVTEPIKEAREILLNMSEGNLLENVSGDYSGDHALMKNSINKTLDSFNHSLNQVKDTIEKITSGSKKASESSLSVSKNATEQASAIEEISATMTEIISQSKKNAEYSIEATSLAEQTTDTARQGNEQMNFMLQAMDEINNSAEQISKIIKVIDEIAFQTNLLALNAAVEAARAGQHGKGFAVVAEEVRSLAHRSAKAAKETTSLIETTVERVSIGSSITTRTADALDQINNDIIKVSDFIKLISSASNEQVTGIKQVTDTLQHIDKTTQINTAVAEDSATASEDLSNQAILLEKLIFHFNLSNSEKLNERTETYNLDKEEDIKV